MFLHFHLFSLLLYSIGSPPSTNGISMGFYHLGRWVMWRWSYPCAISAKRFLWAVLNSGGTHGFVRLHTLNSCLIVSFPFLLLYRLIKPSGSAPKEGENVTAWLHVRCPGQGNTHFIYSWLAKSRRSLGIFLAWLTFILHYNIDIHVSNQIYGHSFQHGSTRAYACTTAHQTFSAPMVIAQEWQMQPMMKFWWKLCGHYVNSLNLLTYKITVICCSKHQRMHWSNFDRRIVCFKNRQSQRLQRPRWKHIW